MNTALITGITGQDGSYLTELLLEKDYEVHGVVRRSSSFNRWRIEHLIQDPAIYGKRLFLHYADLSDDASLRRIFSQTNPDEFYHLAGQSHVGISFKIPEVTTREIANCTLKLLEISRDQDNPPKVYLACSSEIFGNASDSAQNEHSTLKPTSPYGGGKSLLLQYGPYLSGILQFIFVTASFTITNLPVVAKILLPKKSFEAASVAQGKAEFLELGNLGIERDWGYAPDYVLGIWMMLQQDKSADYILATGKTHKLSDFLELSFEYFELDYQNYIRINPKFFRPNEPVQLCGDSSKAQNILGWKPSVSFEKIVHEMCRAAEKIK